MNKKPHSDQSIFRNIKRWHLWAGIILIALILYSAFKLSNNVIIEIAATIFAGLILWMEFLWVKRNREEHPTEEEYTDQQEGSNPPLEQKKAILLGVYLFVAFTGFILASWFIGHDGLAIQLIQWSFLILVIEYVIFGNVIKQYRDSKNPALQEKISENQAKKRYHRHMTFLIGLSVICAIPSMMLANTIPLPNTCEEDGKTCSKLNPWFSDDSSIIGDNI